MKITTDGVNVYNITSSGIDVYDLAYSLIDFIEINSEVTCLNVNLNNLYIGTTSSGVLIRKTYGYDDTISHYFNNDSLPSPHILSVCVEEDYFNVLTSSGIDVYNGAVLEYRDLRGDILNSVQLSNADFYYTTASSVFDKTGQAVYTIEGGLEINNMIAISEHLTNIIVLATTSGVMYIKDDGSEIDVYNIYTEV